MTDNPNATGSRAAIAAEIRALPDFQSAQKGAARYWQSVHACHADQAWAGHLAAYAAYKSALAVVEGNDA